MSIVKSIGWPTWLTARGRDRVVIADDPSRATTDPSIQGMETREIVAQPSPDAGGSHKAEVDTSRFRTEPSEVDTMGLATEATPEPEG